MLKCCLIPCRDTDGDSIRVRFYSNHPDNPLARNCHGKKRTSLMMINLVHR